MTSPPGLHALARLHGLQTAYHDHAGRRVGASPDALMAALRAMGVRVPDAAAVPAALERRRRELWERAVEPVVVAWLPDPAPLTLRLPAPLALATVELAVALEEGGERTAAVDLGAVHPVEREALAGRQYVAKAVPLPPVPAGYHDLHVELDGGARRHRALLIAAPRRAAGWETLPGGPDWGVFAPLHALWEAGASDRIPHFGLLDRLAAPVAGLGGSIVGTLPLLAAFLDQPYEPSPYSPVSKLFWNELYVAAPGDEGGTTAPAGPRGPGPGRAAADAGALDYRAAMAERRRRLEPAARAWFRDRADRGGEEGGRPATGLRVPAEMAAFVRRNPRAPDYARFRALTEAHGPWPGWPDRLRARDVRPDDYDPAVARYHLYAQWQAERQLTEAEERAASRGVALYLDLPLGVDPDGYDVWRERDQFALGATVGAPPDPLAPDGQDWGFHPPHPERSRRDGHAYFIAAIRKHLQLAGVLRIDHVMQLHRMFWVPDGQATEGVYVRYPYDELYAILSLESHRAGSVIVGEDLGTVPRAVRRGMRRHGMPGTYVVQFELEDTDDGLRPRRVPERALAGIGTHDTPMFAAWWTGRDAEIRTERGLMPDEEAAAQVEGRADLRTGLAQGLDVDTDGLAVQEALYRVLGRSRAGLVLANLEDLWMETEPQNVPGTPAEENWQRRARHPVGAIAEGDPARLLTALNDAREGNP